MSPKLNEPDVLKRIEALENEITKLKEVLGKIVWINNLYWN